MAKISSGAGSCFADEFTKMIKSGIITTANKRIGWESLIFFEIFRRLVFISLHNVVIVINTIGSTKAI